MYFVCFNQFITPFQHQKIVRVCPFCLQVRENGDNFTVTPGELSLRVGEERDITVSFKAQNNEECKERYK